MERIRLAIVAVGALALLCAGRAPAASLEEIATFEQPMFVTSDPGDSNRLLVAEREGVVREVSGGESRVFADISPLVVCCESERGLLSIAPAPDFHASGRIYVAYTGKPAAGGEEGDVHVDALSHDAEGRLVRDAILVVPHSINANHNGGQLEFGPDGLLYAGFGDGGGGDDPFNSGQNLETLLGKLVRIDPRPGAEPPYAIPPGNPFTGAAGRDEIWAYGLRNPWRFSFDRAAGDLVIGDVGQGSREEIDLAPSPAPGVVGGAGANYGWDCREGLIEHTADQSPACEGASGFTEPVFDYPHEDPEDGSAHGCSIIGGYVVRDQGLGSLDGRYLYGDLCTGQIRSIDLTAPDPPGTDRAEPGLSVPAYALYSLGEDSCGRLYVVNGSGPVYRIVGDQPSVCPPAQPQVQGPPAGRPRTGVSATRILLHAMRRRHRVVVIRARVRPCAGNRGRRLRLNRGGRPYAGRRLERRCVARFRVRVRRRASFRAVLPVGPGALARSRRLAVRMP